MATFLALCQQLASESGTVNGTLPTAVTSQTGRLGKIVRWTNEAWRSIQTAHGEWKWLRSDFSGPTVASTRAYSGTDLGVASRFGRFLHNGQESERRFSIYLTATGVSDEGQLHYRDYDTFYSTFMRGTQTNDRPVYFTITPDEKLALHPIPDAVYTVRGPYMKDVQNLSADADVPEMPVRFHDLIVEAAMMGLTIHDEAVQQVPLYQLRRLARFSDLEREQLPQFRLAGALA